MVEPAEHGVQFEELARDFFKKTLLLDASNREAADGLKKLDNEKN